MRPVDVLGDIDQTRARTAGNGQYKKPRARNIAQFIDIRYQVIVLGDRQGDAGNIGLLESVETISLRSPAR